MNNRVRWFVTLIILLGVIFRILAQSGTNEDSTAAVNLVIPQSIYVRSGPGNDFLPVGALFAGDRVTPLNISEDLNWVLIQYNRGYGWVQRTLIAWEDQNELVFLPILEPDVTPTLRFPTPDRSIIFPTATPTGSYIQVVDAESAYVRAGPGRNYFRLGQLLPGEPVEAVARNDDTSWIMIRYEDNFMEGFAWVASSLVQWADDVDLDDLPVVDEDNLTPTLTFTPSWTPSLTSTATATATATQTATNTATSTATDTPTLTPSDTSTATDTVTRTPTETDIPTGTPTRTPSDTPTATDIPTDTPTATPTETSTPSPTDTAVPTRTPTSTDTPTATASFTATATDTPTLTPSDTPTATDTPSDTPTVTATPTLTDTPTAIPTETATPTATLTDTPDATPASVAQAAVLPSETATDTSVPTNTPSPTASRTPTATQTPSATPSRTPTATATATDTSTPTATATSTDEPTATQTDTPTDIPTRTPTVTPSLTSTEAPTSTTVPTATDTEITEVALAPVDLTPTATLTLTRTLTPTTTLTPTDEPTATQAIILPETPLPTEPVIVETAPVDDSGTRFPIPPEAIAGLIAFLLVVTYLWLYFQGVAAVNRYHDGFVIDTCPVCEQGELHIEEKQERILGIPRPKRAVRCDYCRSRLREVGMRRWRYAVDPLENEALYERFNGEVITDDQLERLASSPVQRGTPPDQT